MGRFLRDGEFKAKPSTQKKSDRMQGSIKFAEALRRGMPVKVYIGAGWEKGTVYEWSSTRVTIKLNRGNRNVTCYDARNLEIL